MSYALINPDGSLNSTTNADSLFWRNLHLTGLSRLTPAERKNLGIYDHAQKFQETPAGKKQVGFTPEINHAEGILYEIPIFIDKSEAELVTEKSQDLKAKIAALESSVTPRRLRESVLTSEGKKWLEDLDLEIAEIRAELAALPSIKQE